MAELKTKQNSLSVSKFLESVKDEDIRNDCKSILELMKKVIKEEPRMWGGSIVGFGKYHYKYDSGREGDYFLAGFSPRKQNTTLYIMAGFERFPELMKKLGKYKTGSSCLYIKSLKDIDINVLKILLAESVEFMVSKYGRVKK